MEYGGHIVSACSSHASCCCFWTSGVLDDPFLESSLRRALRYTTHVGLSGTAPSLTSHLVRWLCRSRIRIAQVAPLLDTEL